VTASALYDEPGPRARRLILIGTVLGTAVVAGVVLLVVLRLNAKQQFSAALWKPLTDPGVQRALLRGLLATVKAAGLSIACAVVLGAVLAAGRLSDHRWVRVPAVAFIEFFRGIPVLLMILFFFIAFGEVLGTLGSLVLSLALYNGSVLAETYRAGISAVPRGQAEAAYALGLRKTQVMTRILVPQAVRIMLPAIISQCVVALKDTALGFVIAYEELLRTGRLVYVTFFNIIPTVIVVTVLYVTLNLLVSGLATWLEGRTRRRTGRVIGLDLATEMGGGAAPVVRP
jgi:glutamate transport system permease protein